MQCLKLYESAIQAVIEAVKSLEDNELFNAGRGSVLTQDGVAELEASIMEGENAKHFSNTQVFEIRVRKGFEMWCSLWFDNCKEPCGTGLLCYAGNATYLSWFPSTVLEYLVRAFR